MSRYPDDFIWGVATASYQIEGAVSEDGRGESIWDRFSHTPGKVVHGDTGDVACDHYHRLDDDLDLIAWLGVDAYRFSIAWPRVMPNGTGDINHAGLDFYDRLVDGLLERGIQPFPTLYHWDLPQPLEDIGGWRARSVAGAFVGYTEAVVDRLGDRVDKWTTFNEPWCSAVLGHIVGEHAPGMQDVEAGLAAAHHLLLAHGMAVPVIRSVGEAGIVLNMNHVVPASSHPADIEAAEIEDQQMSRWFLDPISGRGYPARAVEAYGWDEKPVIAGDLDLISRSVDFIGLNYYTTSIAESGDVEDADRPDRVAPPDEFTDMDWVVNPRGIVPLLNRLDEYGFREIYITENGAAYADMPDESGFVDDRDRISFLRRHFDAVADAIASGVGVSGYFVWSLMDNFEWAFGYDKRFGIVRVDYETLQRIPKASAHWFREFIG